jgi:hypothetical protein
MQYAKLTMRVLSKSCIVFAEQLLFSYKSLHFYFILIIYGYYLFTFRAPRATIRHTPTTTTLANIAAISHDNQYKIGIIMEQLKLL